MEMQKKICDQEFDMDMKIDLMEEASSWQAKCQIQLTKEKSKRTESLSHNWLPLQVSPASTRWQKPCTSHKSNFL